MKFKSAIFFRNQGIATLEYIVVVLVLMAVFTSMAYMLPRIMASRWKTAADTFGLQKQYDPKKTVECGYYEGVWYEATCFKREYDRIYKSSCSSKAIEYYHRCQLEAFESAAIACRSRVCEGQEEPSP